MGVKFFGQFLIDQGEVDASQVREALDLMEEANPTVGELAVRCGYMSARQAVEVSAVQRSRDLGFGDLAVELGLLETEQLVELVRTQRARRLPIGQALVQLGHLTSDRLGMLLDAYKADQAQYDVGPLELPDALANHRAAAHVIELLPRFLMRVARIQAKVGEIRPFEGRPGFGDYRVSVSIVGVRGLEVALVSDPAFAEALAMATSGLSPRDLDPEMVADGVGEFVNVVAGNAVSAVTKAGQRFSLGPPDYDATLSDGWVVDLAVATGRAALVLSLF
jgi:CheY-specific phosphatase CheX